MRVRGLLKRGAGGCYPCEAIEHRGPDSCGHLHLSGANRHASLHFRRLAVVDVGPRSDQPFGTADRGILVCNGELYNAPELREILRSRGVRFTTAGDTEILHELLLQPDAFELLDHVDGMSAFTQILPDGLSDGSHSARFPPGSASGRTSSAGCAHGAPGTGRGAGQACFTAAEWKALAPKVELDEVTAAHHAVAECDRKLFLPGLNLLYGDRASMRASVELRVPFLGEPVVATALATRPEDQLRLGNGKA
ncbi:asparagine synthase-related protein [Streptomyces sp. NPDC002187]|uniref:asparagine synthase-related protein n=1 Tax=Streptomyces sp. NPDC002187 TaxID=3364637 RepID=UPI00369A768A